MLIRKTFQGEIPENKIANAYSESETDTYSCDYINKNSGKIIYSTNEIDTGSKWIDDKKYTEEYLIFQLAVMQICLLV